MLHIALTSYHLLDAKQKPYQKACLSTKNIEDISGEKKKGRRMGQKTEKEQKKNRRQKEQCEWAEEQKRRL